MIRNCFNLSFFILLFSVTGLHAQWYHQNPLPPSYYYNSSVSFVSSTTGWIAGYQGSLMKTTDAGVTWFSQFTGIMDTLNGVSFGSTAVGSVVTAKGKIVNTTDGGTTWTTTYSDTTRPLKGVFYISATYAWAVGNKGTILKTTNGGSSWAIQSSGTSKTLYSVYFISSSVGWAVGTGRIILKTTDGGSSWFTQTDGTSNYLYSVYFTSSTTGWVAGDQGTILKTTDGGTTWAGQTSSVSLDLRSIYFTSATNGYCAGYYSLLKTTDGGANWANVSIAQYGTYQSICFPTSSIGWVTGDYGALYKTTDGGTTWKSTSYGQRQLLHSIKFSTSQNGVAVGDKGRILRTSDGGTHWNAQVYDSNKALNSVFFASPDTGWLAGEGGICMKTIDSGKTWTSQSVNTTNNLNALYFVSSLKGWVVGANGIILATTDGGSSWNQQISGSSSWNLTQIQFLSQNTGLIYFNDSYYLKTTDGGKYWAKMQGARSDMTSVSFSTPKIGWLTSTYYLFRTTDGGESWDYMNVGSQNNNLTTIHFTSPSTGWAAGNSGKIIHTTDGGRTWIDQTEAEPGRSISFKNLTSIYAVSPSTVWIAGDDGTILKSTNSGSGWISITSPAGGEQWVVGTTKNITWKQQGVTNIKIEFSQDNGTSWQTIASSVPASSGSYSWTLPSNSAASCYIRISDLSKAAESVACAFSFAVIPTPMIKIVSPAGGESWTVGATNYIKWKDSSVTRLKLDYTTNNGSSWTVINSSVDANADSIAWIVPNTPSTQCKVRAIDTSNAAVHDSSHNPFTITSSAQALIVVSSPIGGESWEAMTQNQITWVSANVTNVKLEYTTNNGSNWKLIISSTPASSGSYTWTVPSEASSWCKIRITDVNNASVTGSSPSQFSIYTRSISLTSPVGGENWKFGSQQNITWSSSRVDSTKIEFSSDNGATWSVIHASIPINNKSYPWIINTGPSTQCRIKVSDAGKPAIKDSSAAVFTIFKSTIVLTSPNGGESWVAGTSHPITWTSQNVTSIKLEYSTNGGLNWIAIVNTVTAANGTYNWTLPNTPYNGCKVKISDVSTSSLWDTSASTFNIVPAVILVKDSLSFGSTYVYNPVKLYFTLTNQTSSYQYASLSSSNPIFTIGTPTASIPGNSSQAYAVYFSPYAAGTQTGVIVIDCYPYPKDSLFVSGTGKSITYPTQVTLNKTFSFPATPKQNDYRMLSLPGKNTATMDQIFTGTRGKDWNVYYDNGSSADYFVSYSDSNKFSFSPGLGYWAISKNNTTISKQVATADIVTNYTYKVPIHRGWNIIADPYEKSVQWSRVISASGLDTAAVLYAWNGVWYPTITLLPYQAYYYQNVSGPDTLKFPYDPDGSLSKTGSNISAFPLGGKFVSLTLSGNDRTYSTISAGFDERASDSYDRLDIAAPAGDFEIAGLRLLCNFQSVDWSQYFVEHRHEIGSGQTFDLKLKNQTGDALAISVSRIQGIDQQNEIYLLDRRLNRFIDLRAQNEYIISGIHKEGQLSLLVGNSSYIKTEQEKLLPKTFEVWQNYPNPFNPNTIITYQLPKAENVTVKIFDILGKEIITLINEQQEPGIHEVLFEAGKFSSGVYFYEVKAGKMKQAKKLVLIK